MPKSKSKTKVDKNDVAPDVQESSTPNGTTSIDPSLAALFALSAGPVTVPKREPKTPLVTEGVVAKSRQVKQPVEVEVEAEEEADEVDDDEELSALSSSDEEVEEAEQAENDQSNAETERPRKRRKVDQNEDLEGKYLDKLAREEKQEHKLRKRAKAAETNGDNQMAASDDSDSDLNSGLEDLSDSDLDLEVKDDTGKNGLPKHESLTESTQDIETKKLSRTVFLGNVSISVIKSKSAKKALILHLRSGIDTKHHEKVESIRFRSTAFASDAGPKRAAYAKKELMEETMKSTNAYVVLSSDAAARKVAARLNGTIVLDRHLRVDNLGTPSRVDHRRCIFVGNLSFVDEASANEETEDGSSKRKRAREPADAEEGLWRTFAKCGKVESVRVVRDKETRISKGFAYVQFTDENAVEAALLLNEKKFPPMLPRTLRVSRAKKDMKGKKREVNGVAPNVARTKPGATEGRRSGPGLGQRGPPRSGSDRSNGKPVFEGHRATSKSMPKGLKKLKKRPATKPDNRGSKRAAAFRAGGGRKKRDADA